MLRSSSATQKQAVSALRAAASATLNPTIKPKAEKGMTVAATLDPQGSFMLPSAATLKFAPEPKQASVPTVWDEPHALEMKTTRKLQTLGASVKRMGTAFEGAMQIRVEKRQMMDEVHEQAVERVDKNRSELEDVLANLSKYIGKFTSDWERTLGQRMDEFSVMMKDRVHGMTERYERLEERLKAIRSGIEEETASRIRDTEEVLVPIRETVARLSDDLQREQAIRRNREEELEQFMEESVKMLEENVATEVENRKRRFEDLSHEVDIEIRRLKEHRHEAKLIQIRQDLEAELEKDLENEVKFRKEGQDHIVEEITKFINKFHAHVKEEGMMGN